MSMAKLQQVVLAFIGLVLLILLGVILDEELPEISERKDILGTAEEEYFVSRVVDGDTIVVQKDGQEYRVRMIGIDTPETVHPSKPVECFGLESTKKLKSLVEEKYVTLEPDETQDDIDRYGRLLRYVYLDEKDINLIMIREGYAFEYTYMIPYTKQEEYISAQSFARENEIGLWNPLVCDYN
jgi:micrococcal nuclease